MRMNLFFGNMFWGILLVLWGASLILRTFNINMPLAKIFFCGCDHPVWTATAFWYQI